MKKVLKLEIIISLVVFAILLLIGFNTDTTGDAGDSITHYLYSHYSFEYPRFFLHHWAKPVFVLLSAPFAYFGFKGIIVFNSLCATLIALFTYYTARNLKLNNIWLVFVFTFFAPLYFKLIFSGLTEYLFGLFLIIGIYMISTSKFSTAFIIVSFLPLIRSEGLLILGVFALYSLVSKKYKLLPLLLTGQLIYSLIGAFYYNDILWVFNKIPYNNLGSPYGNGKLTDFIFKLNYVIEKPIYLLLGIGSISLAYSFFRSGFKNNNNLKVVLILGSFTALFVAHTVFWWLGIFNSMGLPRVLIVAIPLIAIISLVGVQTITSKLKNTVIKNTLLLSILLLVSLYPFTNREQGVVFDRNLFAIEENNLIAEEVVPFIENEFPDYSSNTVFFSHPYLSLALNIDYFNPNKHKEIQYLQGNDIDSSAIIIWDDWFSVVEGGMTLEQLISDGRFKLLQTFTRQDKKRTITIAVLITTANN